jgi:hypothetical protein
MARIGALFKVYAGGRAWKGIGDTPIKPCYLIREENNRKLGLGNKEQMLEIFLRK